MHRTNGGAPLKHAIPSSENKPILGFRADTDAADDVLQFSLHFLRGLAFVRESIEIGLKRRALPLEGVWRERAGLRGRRVRDRNVVFIHAEKCGV